MLTNVLTFFSFLFFSPEAGLAGEELFPPSSELSQIKEETSISVRYQPIETSKDSRAPWINLLFQKMIAKDLSVSNYLQTSEAPSGSQLSLNCEKCDLPAAQAHLDFLMQSLRSDGFSEEAFQETKKELLHVLAQKEDAATLTELVSSIQMQDLSPLILTLSLESKAPTRAIFFDITTAFSTEEFDNLPLQDWEKETIAKIVTTIAEKNPVKLAFEKRNLDKKGKKIRHVHPLRFMGYILADNHLRQSMREIKKSYFKWEAFMDGFGGKMKEEASKNNLQPYVPGFAQSLNADPSQISTYIDKHDWEGLVRSFL